MDDTVYRLLEKSLYIFFSLDPRTDEPSVITFASTQGTRPLLTENPAVLPAYSKIAQEIAAKTRRKVICCRYECKEMMQELLP